MRCVVAFLIGLLTQAACGDITRSAGEFGRMSFALYSTYNSPQSDLVDATLVTRYPQIIETDLTPQGARDIEDPARLSLRASPDQDVTLKQGLDSFTVLVEQPGTYAFEYLLDDEVMERITLSFDAPDGLELVTWLRDPGQSDFRKGGSGALTVAAGTQATLLPIPTKSGERLLGDIDVDTLVAPSASVVSGVNILHVNENEVWETDTPASVYFIASGMVDVTVSEPVHQVSQSQAFTVQ